jgi:hypothetical protein
VEREQPVKRWLKVAAAACAGVLVGASITIAIQAWSGRAERIRSGLNAIVANAPIPPATFLVWVPRGLPVGFPRDVRALPRVGRLAAVAEDDAWLRRSWSAGGELVDDPPRPYRIPLDTAAVDVRSFAPFVPAADRESIEALANGQAILGATSATLRGLGPGATLDFGGGAHVTIAGVLPDELVGGAELLVSRSTGRTLGVDQNRYLLVQPTDGKNLIPTSFAERLHRLLPAVLGVNRSVQVRAPGDTPFFRAGDAVLPPVLLKAVFGEFAARRAKGTPGALEIDPAWERTHLVTTSVPVLGTVTCHRGIIDQLRGAMRELVAANLEATVHSYHGCYVPRFIGWDAANMVSYHSWGVAFDVNLGGNVRGATPHQDPRLVRTLERWGFQWGGHWIVPDGNHFEYRRTPSAVTASR